MKSQKYQEAEKIIRLLDNGRYYCECPCGCGGEINLKDAGLFYDDNFTRGSLEAKKLMEDGLNELRSSLKSKRLHQAGKTKSVNLGLTAEKIITTLDDFKFEHKDCRSIFKPIDFLIFEGLSKKGRVSKIFFAEVKSGAGRLIRREMAETLGVK